MMKVDLSSPQALLNSLHQATQAQDYGAMLECFDDGPLSRRVDGILAVTRNYASKVTEVTQLVEDAVGVEEAKDLADAFALRPRSPLPTREADGSVDWARLTATIEGKKAVIVGSDGSRIDATRSDSGWRIGDGAGFVIPASFFRHTVAQRERELTMIRQAVRAGQVNKGNFRKVLYPDASPAVWEPFGPWTEGVRISIFPTHSHFVSGGPYEFLVTIEFSRNDVGFRVPGEMIGENTIVEIDGERVPIPHVAADTVMGGLGSGIGGVPMRIPTSIGIGLGKHTLRYSIVSLGGKCHAPSGRMIQQVNGTIVSNVVSFEVE